MAQALATAPDLVLDSRKIQLTYATLIRFLIAANKPELPLNGAEQLRYRQMSEIGIRDFLKSRKSDKTALLDKILNGYDVRRDRGEYHEFQPTDSELTQIASDIFHNITGKPAPNLNAVATSAAISTDDADEHDTSNIVSLHAPAQPAHTTTAQAAPIALPATPSAPIAAENPAPTRQQQSGPAAAPIVPSPSAVPSTAPILTAPPTARPAAPAIQTTHGALPTPKIRWVKANSVFSRRNPIPALDFDIPFYDWEQPHPDVPTMDPELKSYAPQLATLATALYNMAVGSPTQIIGPKGTGKTTLVKFLGAKLQIPTYIFSVDRTMDRRTLVGGLRLLPSETGTRTKFADGILTQAITQQALIGFDEFDTMNQDLAYALNGVVEYRPLTLYEDEGRRVEVSPMTRYFAMANTLGDGNSGVYVGTNELSSAFRDRWKNIIRVNYIEPAEEQAVIQRRTKVDNTDDEAITFIQQVTALAADIRQSHANGDCEEVCSMRVTQEVVNRALFFRKLIGFDNAKTDALNYCLINRCNDGDKSIIKTFIRNRSIAVIA